MRHLNEETAKALSRLPAEIVKWFEDSLLEQLQDNMTSEPPHDKWGQGKAQALDEICKAIKNARKTAEKLAR